MGNTTHGLPYPDDNAPVAEGARGIKALAEAVDLTGHCVRTDPGGQSIPQGAFTVLEFDVEPAAGNGFPGPAVGVTYSGGTFTIQKAGLWHVSFHAGFSASTAGRRIGLIYVKQAPSATFEERKRVERGPNSQSASVDAGTFIRLAVGDAVQFQTYQNSGAPLTISSSIGPVATMAECHWMGP